MGRFDLQLWTRFGTRNPKNGDGVEPVPDPRPSARSAVNPSVKSAVGRRRFMGEVRAVLLVIEDQELVLDPCSSDAQGFTTAQAEEHRLER